MNADAAAPAGSENHPMPRAHIAPLLLALALAFWGWQTRNLLASAGFALAMLLPALTQLRLDLAERDQHRIADLTMILYIAVAASFIATDGLRSGVHDSLVWLPGVALPLMLAQTMGVENRVPMTALFRYLRRQKARGIIVGDARIDLTGPYLATILIAAGMANREGYGFFTGVALILAAALWQIKPSRVAPAAWVAALGIAVGVGFGVQTGLFTLQSIVEDWIIDWQFSGPVADPYRSSTRIGEIGRLKFDDAIVLRVYAGRDGRDKPALLHQASYNHYVGQTWLARQGSLEPLRAGGDGTQFRFAAAAPRSGGFHRLRLSQRVEHGHTLLSLPLDTLQVSDLVASRVKRNAYGAVQAEMDVPWTFYYADYDPAGGAGKGRIAPPDAEDLEVPEKERPALENVVRQLGLRAVPPAEAARRIEGWFAGFQYTTVRDHPFSDLLPGNATPLAEFLNTTHRGHCEYFATATTLLLRAAGIPARYATGFAVGDWSEWERAWIVRERHAHAWSTAYIDGQWRDLDTTPAAWFADEESLAPTAQRLVDFLRWAGFRWTTRDDSDTKVMAWVVVGIAVLLLVWKLVSEGGLVRLAERRRGAGPLRPGGDSEFFALETALAKTVPRGRGETLYEWLPRASGALAPAARDELAALAGLHYRYRFDPQGLDATQRDSLRGGCAALLRNLGARRTPTGG